MIIYNAIRTPDGTVIESKHRWDYQAHTDANGKVYAVDGGHDYLRRIGPPDYTELSVTSEDKHEVIRKVFKWRSYGKSGNEPARDTALKDLTDNHIQNILLTQVNLDATVKWIFCNEQEYRKYHNITSNED